MSPSPPRKPRSRALTIFFVLAAMGACVPCIGITAAVAIPGFIGYVRRSKTAEAQANLPMLARSVIVAYEMERMPIDGAAVSRVFPPAVPPTPAVPGTAKQFWPADADPGWAALDFAPADPIYYSYEYAPDADGRGFAVRARGDLDGDGTLSLFEIRGHVDEVGDVMLDPIAVTDEIE